MNRFITASVLFVIIAYLETKELETIFSKKKNTNTLKILRGFFLFCILYCFVFVFASQGFVYQELLKF